MSTKTPPAAHNQKTTVALFNYGGGMRGLVSAHFMAKMEEVTGLRMADMVDIFAGPSTGAILNAAMNVRHPEQPGRPKYRARHMVKFYEREGIKIFPQDSFREMRGIIHDFNNRTLKLGQLNSLMRHGHYDPAYLTKSIRTLFGDARLSESLRSLVIPTYNLDGEQTPIIDDTVGNAPRSARAKNAFLQGGGHAVWLKNILTGYPSDAHRYTPDVLLSDAVLASTAAPSYFPCHHFKARQPGIGTVEYAAIDGVVFDNPCISYLGAIRQHVPPGNRLIMIILGTGYTNKSVKRDDWNRYGGLGIVDPANDLPLINIFFHASESALMDSFSNEMGDNLFIFNKSMVPGRSKPGAPSTQIDDASPEQLKALGNFYQEILEENKGKFDDVCQLLVSNRDQREKEKIEKRSITSRVRYFMSAISGKDDKDESNT